LGSEADKAIVSRTLGVILIALGLAGLIWGGFTWTTTKKIVDIGPIHATREQTHKIPLPPMVGAFAFIGGVVLLVAAKRA
jgi:UDP-N-acetylmuramyl pentapeptide phosphotransferase/UDP-N-acetylglucosamine-1-phosphate transferase